MDSSKKLLVYAFFIFSLFVGAGNIFLPPTLAMANYGGGVLAITGFALTAIGLPLAGLIAIRKAGDYLKLFSFLPAVICTVLMLVLYISIGPLFAIPRTAAVSFELGIQPFSGAGWLPVYSAVYFVCALFLAMNTRTITRYIGKFVSPVLIFCLCLLAFMVWFGKGGVDFSEVGTGSLHNLSDGIITGYLTMDGMASIVFGSVVLKAMAQDGGDDRAHRALFGSSAALAAVLMLLMYISLALLGVRSFHALPAGASGNDAIQYFVVDGFGMPGQIVCSVVIILACLTTTAGLLTACASYFQNFIKIGYRSWLLVCAVFSYLISIVGLEAMLQMSIPVLVAIYPMFMAALGAFYAGEYLRIPAASLRLSVVAVIVFSIINAVVSLPLLASSDAGVFFAGLPWNDKQLTWLLVFAVCLIVSAGFQLVYSGRGEDHKKTA